MPYMILTKLQNILCELDFIALWESLIWDISEIIWNTLEQGFPNFSGIARVTTL